MKHRRHVCREQRPGLIWFGVMLLATGLCASGCSETDNVDREPTVPAMTTDELFACQNGDEPCPTPAPRDGDLLCCPIETTASIHCIATGGAYDPGIGSREDSCQQYCDVSGPGWGSEPIRDEHGCLQWVEGGPERIAREEQMACQNSAPPCPAPIDETGERVCCGLSTKPEDALHIGGVAEFIEGEGPLCTGISDIVFSVYKPWPQPDEFGCLQWERRESFSEDDVEDQALIDCQNGDELCDAPGNDSIYYDVVCCPIAESAERDCFAEGGSVPTEGEVNDTDPKPMCASSCKNRLTKYGGPFKDENGCFEWVPLRGDIVQNERRDLPMFDCQDGRKECAAPDADDDSTFCCEISQSAPDFDDEFRVGGSFQSDDGIENADSCVTTEVDYGDVSEMYVETNTDGCLEWKFGE